MLETSTQQVQDPRKEMSHKVFKDLKENMIVPVVQVPSITLESLKMDTLVDRIKENFDQKAFTLLEKSSYDFSNSASLGELKDKVNSENIHGLTQRKQEHYVTTPKFGLGFRLPKHSNFNKEDKEIASSTISQQKGEKVRIRKHNNRPQFLII